jgi:hypothetical protein
MAQALPLLKLGGLLVRTLAKPMASGIKNRLRRHPVLSEQVGVMGQGLHQISSRINVVSSGYKFVGAKPLNHEDAVAKGANAISEGFIFFVAATVATFEYFRSENKSALKAQKQAAKEAEEERKMAEWRLSVEERIGRIEILLQGKNGGGNDDRQSTLNWLASLGGLTTHNAAVVDTKKEVLTVTTEKPK